MTCRDVDPAKHESMTYGDISDETASYAARDMLRHAEPFLSLSRFAQPIVLLSSLPW